MMLKNLINYLKFSGAWFGFVLNPYHWEFCFNTNGSTDLDPKLKVLFISLGPVWTRIAIDDGSW